MLWLYMDESAEHDATNGAVHRFTLGGGIATSEAWEALSVEWKAHLDRFRSHGIEVFHMTDFEAHKSPFDKLTDAEGRDLIGGLMDISLRHVPFFVGAADEPHGAPIWRRYSGNVLKIVDVVGQVCRNVGEPITLVLALNKDSKGGRWQPLLERWCEEDGGFFTLGGFGNPRLLCALQVADIVAYEFSRHLRAIKPPEPRYPLKRMQEAQGGCFLLSSHFLGKRLL